MGHTLLVFAIPRKKSLFRTPFWGTPRGGVKNGQKWKKTHWYSRWLEKVHFFNTFGTPPFGPLFRPLFRPFMGTPRGCLFESLLDVILNSIFDVNFIFEISFSWHVKFLHCISNFNFEFVFGNRVCSLFVPNSDFKIVNDVKTFIIVLSSQMICDTQLHIRDGVGILEYIFEWITSTFV